MTSSFRLRRRPLRFAATVVAAALAVSGAIATLAGHGVKATGIPSTFSNIQGIAVQSDGKIVIVGSFGSFNGLLRQHVARLNTDGSLDLTFGRLGVQGSSTGGANGQVDSVAIQSVGGQEKVLVGLSQATGFIDGVSVAGLARLNTDGSVDTAFTTALGTVDGKVEKVQVLANGKIFIAGSFNNINGTARVGVAILNADGSLDTSFDANIPASKVTFSYPAVAGITNDPTAQGVFYNTALMSGGMGKELKIFDGTSTTTKYFGGTPWAITSTSDNAVLVGGSFATNTGEFQTNKCLAKFDSMGTRISSFNSGVLTACGNAGVNAIVEESNGSFIIGGEYNGGAKIGRLNAAGTTLTDLATLNSGGIQVYALAKQSTGGKDYILVGGYFNQVNSTSKIGLARIDAATGALDTTFPAENSATPTTTTTTTTVPARAGTGSGGATSATGTPASTSATPPTIPAAGSLTVVTPGTAGTPVTPDAAASDQTAAAIVNQVRLGNVTTSVRPISGGTNTSFGATVDADVPVQITTGLFGRTEDVQGYVQTPDGKFYDLGHNTPSDSNFKFQPMTFEKPGDFKIYATVIATGVTPSTSATTAVSKSTGAVTPTFGTKSMAAVVTVLPADEESTVSSSTVTDEQTLSASSGTATFVDGSQVVVSPSGAVTPRLFSAFKGIASGTVKATYKVNNKPVTFTCTYKRFGSKKPSPTATRSVNNWFPRKFITAKRPCVLPKAAMTAAQASTVKVVVRLHFVRLWPTTGKPVTQLGKPIKAVNRTMTLTFGKKA